MRLAASARSPQTSIRPLVNPLFGRTAFPAEPLEISTEEILSPPERITLNVRKPRVGDAQRPGTLAPHPAALPKEASAKSVQEEVIRDKEITREVNRGPAGLRDPLRDEIQRAPEARLGSIAASPHQPLMHEDVRSRYAATPSAGNPNREPDEINIHIGRIEVTAVPPPAASPRPLSKARKSVSLDEYLKRGRR